MNYLSILGKAARSIVQDPVGGHDARHHLALGRATEKAVTTGAAVGDPGQNDVIADGQRGHSLA